MSDVQPHQHLFSNLQILHQLSPGTSDFAKCVKEDMFNRPNRNAFDQVIYYLCRTYDSARYLPKIPWPVLDRTQERTFRQNTVALIKEIIQEKPEARIPSFSPSFLSSPGGDRLIKFMWKFSLLVLKTVVERESDEPVLDYPTAGTHIINALTEMNLEEIRKGMDDLCGLLIDAHTFADKLKNDLQQQAEELKTLQSENKTLIQSLDFLSEQEKSVLISGESPQWEDVIEKWSGIFSHKTDEGIEMLKKIEIKSRKIKECYDSVKTLVDSKTMPVVLDGSKYPPSVKDCNGNLDIAEVLFQASKAASSISKNISASGGLQPLHSVLPVLESIHAQFQSVETSLSEAKAGYLNLLSASSGHPNYAKLVNVGSETPPLKGSLKLGYKMLQDAQMPTPPMVFNINSNFSSKCSLSAESPPIETLMRKSNPILMGKLNPEAGISFTPKASKSFRKPEFSSKALLMGVSSKSYANNAIETPAHFGQSQPASSTVCKPTSSLNHSMGPALSPVSKFMNSKGPRNKNLVQTELLFSNNEEVLKECGGSRDAVFDDVLNGRNQNQDPIRKKEDLNSKNGEEAQHETPLRSLDVATADLHKIAILSTFNHSRQVANNPQEVTERQAHQSKFAACETSLEGPHSFTNVLPKVTVSNSVCETTFDSPHSSLGIFSPVSANNSFFNDSHCDERSTTGCVPKFDLDFEDEISPSGRVSLCPSNDVKEPVVEAGPSSNASKVDSREVPCSKPSSRRKSLQAIISRYREIVASSKAHEPVKVSPPSSPELDLHDEDPKIDLDLNLDLE